jgi:hypothetical protein
MIKMFFHIQFREQLRKTRPELVVCLEKLVAASVCDVGGSAETGRKVLEASFD